MRLEKQFAPKGLFSWKIYLLQIGRPSGTKKLRRSEMFVEYCEKSGLKPHRGDLFVLRKFNRTLMLWK